MVSKVIHVSQDFSLYSYRIFFEDSIIYIEYWEQDSFGEMIRGKEFSVPLDDMREFIDALEETLNDAVL